MLTIDTNLNTKLPKITLFKGVFDFVPGSRFVVQYLISLDWQNKFVGTASVHDIFQTAVMFTLLNVTLIG